jgi:hypothetical protein
LRLQKSKTIRNLTIYVVSLQQAFASKDFNLSKESTKDDEAILARFEISIIDKGDRF